MGGNFGSYNGTTANRLVRLNADGSLDAGFNGGGAGANSTVSARAVQADGKVLVGSTLRPVTAPPPPRTTCCASTPPAKRSKPQASRLLCCLLRQAEAAQQLAAVGAAQGQGGPAVQQHFLPA